MNRSMALRASFSFTILTALAAMIGFSSQAAIAEATFLVGASLSAIMLFFALMTPSPEAKRIPVRIRS